MEMPIMDLTPPQTSLPPPIRAELLNHLPTQAAYDNTYYPLFGREYTAYDRGFRDGRGAGYQEGYAIGIKDHSIASAVKQQLEAMRLEFTNYQKGVNKMIDEAQARGFDKGTRTALHRGMIKVKVGNDVFNLNPLDPRLDDFPDGCPTCGHTHCDCDECCPDCHHYGSNCTC